MVDLQPHPTLRPQRAAVQGPEMGSVSVHGADFFLHQAAQTAQLYRPWDQLLAV